MKNKKCFDIEEYYKYKNVIKNTLDSLSNLKSIEKENNLLKLGKEEELFSEFLFFLNFPKIIFFEINNIFNEKINILNELKKIRINLNIISNNEKIFKMLLHFQIFLLSKIDDLINLITIQKTQKLNLAIIKEINQSLQTLIKIILILLKIYKEKKIELNIIILFFSSINIFINKKNNNNDDKYIKVKNIIFLSLLIEKYFGYFLTLLSNEQKNNKINIILLFSYLLKFLNNDELKQNFNYEIMNNRGLLKKLISLILNSFIENKNVDIYKRYKYEMLNCFANIFKNNTYKFNFFELLINQNKQSFINLDNYKTRKGLIIKDFYSQNFCIELLYKLFNNEKDFSNNSIKIENNYFLFNGFNSKMTFNLNELSLNNCYIFFSFQLSKDVINLSSTNFPLIYLESKSGDISIKFYIIKEKNNNMKLYLYQEFKEKSKNININKCLNKIGNILLDKFYILSMRFFDKKMGIYITDLNYNKHIIFEENDIVSKTNEKIQILKIGHSDKEKEYFKGYFGPFFIIKNIYTKKSFKPDKIISSILDLKILYKFFPFLLSDSSTYNFNEIIFFDSSEKENKIKDMKYLSSKFIKKFKCEMLLYPELINIYYSLILKDEKEENCFIKIPNLISDEKYKIIDINISLSKKSYIHIDFLRNNGLDFFALIFEYFYQFFKLLELDKDEMDFYLNDNNIENIFINSIKIILSIIGNNYVYYKYIIIYTKKYKTLFRNLIEILKIRNNHIIQNISSELHKLLIGIENELNILRYKYNLKDESEKILSNFSNGLKDIIYDHELYINSPNNDNLNYLFNLTILILKEHKKYNKNLSDEFFPFNKNFFLKLLKFIKLLENSFTDNYIKKNSIVDSYLNLIKVYLDSVNNKKNKRYYYRQLYSFVFKNFEDNLNIVINILYFMNEIISEIPELEDFELFNEFFLTQNQEKENKNINFNINSILFSMILKMSFIDDSNKIIDKVKSKLKNINSPDILSTLLSELEKIFQFFLKNKNEKNIELNNKTNHMKLFEKIFDFFLILLEFIIMKYQTQISENNIIELNDDLFSKYLNIFENLLNVISNIKNRNINYVYCLINFLIFFYKTIFSEIKKCVFSNVKFIQNLIQVIELCDKYFLLNCFQLFKFSIANLEYHKTIIEIIYDISIQLFLNYENFDNNCYNKLMELYNFIFYDRNFIDNVRHSIFYVSDRIKYILEKDIKLNDIEFQNKCKLLKNYNTKYFVEEDIFNGNMSTYFLCIIFENQNKINNQNENKISPISRLAKFYYELFCLILEEHLILYKLNKQYFFYKISSNYPIDILNYIKNKYIKEKNRPLIDEVKNNIEPLLETFRKENNKLNNIKQNSDEIKIDIEPTKDLINKEIYNKILEIPDDNKIQFFYDLDKNYVTNIKKEIMNCVFSFYYFDEFFYCQDFCIIKKYYINNILNKKENLETKQLNYPNKLKNYRNNFEPPLFIKKFNNYILDPYFPISHSYIENESLKNKLIMEKSIKLFPKEIINVDSDKEIECEFIKNENAFYGKLYYNDYDNYLLFKEQKINFSNEEGFDHIFLISNYYENKKGRNDKTEIFDKRIYPKNILIILNNIEEIIEIRILLLWKGIEIYLKNGKSYIFNFLTTKQYNNFMTNFINKNKINNLIRKRNFLSDKNNITQYWVKNLITNYEYLLILNRYSSRSFNDPSQYPVFPWLLNNYKNFDLFCEQEKYYNIIKNEYKKIKQEINDIKEQSSFKIEFPDKKDILLMKILKNLIKDELKEDEKLYIDHMITKLETSANHIKDYITFNSSQYFKFLKKGNNRIKKLLRNFRYPPSINNESQKSNFKIKFENESKDSKFPYHYGIHYSNSVFIFYFLMRQQPYDNLLIKTQSYNLESPNRMFINLVEFNKLNAEGNDNRELIPELFSKIEFLLNLNCDFYGRIVINNRIVDDYEINYSVNNKKNPLSYYIDFILKNKNILNNKIIGRQLNKWIDIIFGVMQLPPLNKRKESYNIFERESYEQEINLENKLEKLLNKKESNIKLTNSIIKNKINLKIIHILNLGVTPSQLFKKKHPKLEWIFKNNNKKDKLDRQNKIKSQNFSIESPLDLEELINETMKPKQLLCKIKGNPLFFSINLNINKIFVYNKEDNLIILNSSLFNENKYKYFYILNDDIIEKANILYSKENQIYQIKYSFSSFDIKMAFNDDLNNYHTFYYKRINYLINKGKIKAEIIKNDFDSFMMVTCRHIDLSFKIYYFDKMNQKNKNKILIYSFICEDFVTCCCCLSSNSFIIGLNNGKLIYYILNKNDITLKKEMYIQGHQGKINTMEIDIRLGVLITSGDDNYIFIRKLYDFELLLPIKIKDKYSILMTKISSHNFLYILCFNKINNKNIIFGYTLSGIKFAKSEYSLYDNINFDEEGNLITINNKNDIIFLSGSDLTKINNKKEGKIKRIKRSNWIEVDSISEEKDEELNQVITFFENINGNNFIKSYWSN